MSNLILDLLVRTSSGNLDPCGKYAENMSIHSVSKKDIPWSCDRRVSNLWLIEASGFVTLTPSGEAFVYCHEPARRMPCHCYSLTKAIHTLDKHTNTQTKTAFEVSQRHTTAAILLQEMSL
jgi:hypothetical protein